jgi:hypothetical protein
MVEETVSLVVRTHHLPRATFAPALPTPDSFNRALSALPLLFSTVGIVWAPKIEVYTALACMAHKPEVFDKQLTDGLLSIVGPAMHHVAADTLPQICATDPEVRRVVAKLSAG